MSSYNKFTTTTTDRATFTTQATRNPISSNRSAKRTLADKSYTHAAMAGDRKYNHISKGARLVRACKVLCITVAVLAVSLLCTVGVIALLQETGAYIVR